MSTERVLLERAAPGVALVTLNYPERMNSMSFDAMVPLRDLLRELSVDNDVRAVVLTGAGAGFCSGADQSGERGRMPHVQGLTQVRSPCGPWRSSTRSCSRCGRCTSR